MKKKQDDLTLGLAVEKLFFFFFGESRGKPNGLQAVLWSSVSSDLPPSHTGLSLFAGGQVDPKSPDEVAHGPVPPSSVFPKSLKP